MLSIIERTPDIYLDEIVQELYNLHHIVVSIPTVYRTMKEEGLEHKKVCLISISLLLLLIFDLHHQSCQK